MTYKAKFILLCQFTPRTRLKKTKVFPANKKKVVLADILWCPLIPQFLSTLQIFGFAAFGIFFKIFLAIFMTILFIYYFLSKTNFLSHPISPWKSMIPTNKFQWFPSRNFYTLYKKEQFRCLFDKTTAQMLKRQQKVWSAVNKI